MASKTAHSDQPVDIEELLDIVDKALDRVKVLYEQYFLGMQKQPPTQIHTDVERRLRDLQQLQIRNTGLRYRFATLQQKFGSYNSYWRRTLRQIENGTYIRQLSKISRQAAATGEAIPEEILAAMPKRMREQVKRDREQALSIAARRRAEHGKPDNEFLEEEAPASIPTAAKTREPAKGTHILSGDDFDLDIDSFFASIENSDDAPKLTPAVAAKPAPSPAPPPSIRPPVPGASQTGPRPAIPGASQTGARPVVPGTPPPSPRPAVPGASQTGSRPAIPGASQTGPQPVVPSASQTGARPVVPGASQTGSRPAVPGASQTGPRPAVPGASQTGPRPAMPSSQTGPQPVVAGAGPHAAAAKRPQQPPARPPPGMNDADVNALYAKYVKAKEMVGETAGPGAYSKLMNTINAQAPKIMEQYKAKGVEFSVVVKDNQVIIKAKPKT